MIKALKAALKYLAYLSFFTAMLVGFVYVMLPLEAVQAYAVRKASDEYNADLDITTLETWGVSGFQAQGVTLTPRPTPVQIAEMRKARKARKAWFAAKKEREAAAKEAPPASMPAKKGKKDKKAIAKGDAAAADAKAEKAGTDDKTDTKLAGEEGDTKGKLAKKAKAKAKPVEDKAPALPTGTEPFYIESLKARVSPMDLINGIIEGSLEVELLGGSIDAKFKHDKKDIKLDANWDALDLRQLSLLKTLLPLPMTGAFNGEIDLNVPLTDKGQPRLANAEGHIDLRIDGARIGPGQIASPKMPFPFDVPATRMEDFGGRLNFEKRKATFEDFGFGGKDVEGEITGFIQLANTLEKWVPRAHLRFKFSDAFLTKNKDVKSALKSVRYLKKGQAGGWTGLEVRGTFKAPKWKPKARSPYKRQSRRARAKRKAPKKARPKRNLSKRPKTKPRRNKRPSKFKSSASRRRLDLDGKDTSKAKTASRRKRRTRKTVVAKTDDTDEDGDDEDDDEENTEEEDTETETAKAKTDSEDGTDAEEGDKDEEEGDKDEEEGDKDEEEGDKDEEEGDK